MENQTLDLEILDKAGVCELLRISTRTLEQHVLSGIFPPPVRRGKSCYWSKRATTEWHLREFSAQEAWRPKKTLRDIR